MILIIIVLIIWIVCLYFKLMQKNCKYLGDTSSLKLKIKEKVEEVYNLEKEVSYLKNLKSYEEYLNA